MTEIQKPVYIPKGKIVPNWVLRLNNKKREKHKIKSNGFYVVRHKDGALYMFPRNDGEFLIIAKDLKNIHIQSAPYTKHGSVMFSCKEAAMKALDNPVIDSRGVRQKLPNCPAKEPSHD